MTPPDDDTPPKHRKPRSSLSLEHSSGQRVEKDEQRNIKQRSSLGEQRNIKQRSSLGEQRNIKWHKPLEPEDVALWEDVKKTVKRLPRRAEAKTVQKTAALNIVTSDKPKAKPHLKTVLIKPVAPERVVRSPALHKAEIDRPTLRKIKKGRVEIEDSLDLHGMRQDAAHRALEQFIVRAVQKGYKLVLVVTGKGDRSYASGAAGGVLRKSVPLWLEDAKLTPLVLSYRSAVQNHGGEGAYYVRLRRKR